MQEKIIVIDGRMYLLYGKVSHQQDKIVLEYTEDNENFMQIPDLANYLKSKEDISNIGQPIQGDIELFLKKHLEDYTNGLIDENRIMVPRNFTKFVKS